MFTVMASWMPVVPAQLLHGQPFSCGSPFATGLLGSSRTGLGFDTLRTESLPCQSWLAGLEGHVRNPLCSGSKLDVTSKKQGPLGKPSSTTETMPFLFSKQTSAYARAVSFHVAPKYCQARAC